MLLYFFLRRRVPVLWLVGSGGWLWVCTVVSVLVVVLGPWTSVAAAGPALTGSVWLTVTSSTFPGLDTDTSASDCRRHLVELHSKMADMEMRLTGWLELWWFDDASSLRERPLGGEVLRRNLVARWNRPSFFFFSSRGGSQSSPGTEFLRASLMSYPRTTEASNEPQPYSTESVFRRADARFRLLVGVSCGVVEVDEVDVVVEGSSVISGEQPWPPAPTPASPSPQGPLGLWGSSLHRGRSMYTWLGNLSCFGLELLSGLSCKCASSLPAPTEIRGDQILYYICEETSAQRHIKRKDFSLTQRIVRYQIKS